MHTLGVRSRELIIDRLFALSGPACGACVDRAQMGMQSGGVEAHSHARHGRPTGRTSARASCSSTLPM
jgi:hypothetical protein